MPIRRTLPADATIGERLRRLRAERGLTQEQLAERAGLSTDMIKKLEQGRRDTARLTTLVALANAMDVPVSHLTDRRPRLNGAGDRVVLDIRDALLNPDLLPGIDPDDDGPPPNVDRIRQLLRQSWADYLGGNFLRLAQVLPGLIGEARAASHALGAPMAAELAQAYQLAGWLLTHLGREDLSIIGAERAIVTATAGDDELQHAALYGTYAWALLGQGRNDEAERVAAQAAARIEPKLSTATQQHLIVWGRLALWAMAGAVLDGRGDVAMGHISLARAAAARIERDGRAYYTEFGPTQVAMQTTFTHTVLGEPDKALTAARDVHHDDLSTIGHGRHLLDVAQAHADMRRTDEAVATLTTARDLAPVWFRHQPPARELVADLAGRRARPTAALRGLIRSLEPH